MRLQRKPLNIIFIPVNVDVSVRLITSNGIAVLMRLRFYNLIGWKLLFIYVLTLMFERAHLIMSIFWIF